MLVVVAAGAVLLSVRWLAATLYLAWGAWGVGAFLIGPSERWATYLIGMVGATVLAVFVNHLRRADVREVADLRAAAEGLTAPDVQRTYQQLLSASQQHLAAFEHRL